MSTEEKAAEREVCRWGLALSGGGFRATAFHLGTIACMRDFGVLSKVTHVTSVSGGSILAAHMLMHWREYTSSEDAVFAAKVEELITLMKRDVRGRVVRRYISWRIINSIARKITLGKISCIKTTASLLDSEYKTIYGNIVNSALENGPDFDIMASNLTIGGSCSFSATEYCLHHQFAGRSEAESIRAEAIPLSIAVTASSALPGFISPIWIDGKLIQGDLMEPSTQLLTDGGVFDNLGSRRFETLLESQTVDHVLVSDAGKPFRREQAAGNPEFFGPATRAAEIMGECVNLFEKKAIREDPRFSLVEISDIIESHVGKHAIGPVDHNALPYELQMAVRGIRTDLDVFTNQEIGALMVHGYIATRASLRRNNLLNGDFKLTPPMSVSDEHQNTSISRLQSTTHFELSRIKSGARRKLRLFAISDPISWVHLASLFLLVGLGYGAYRALLPVVTNLVMAVRSYYVVHGMSLPSEWSQQEPPEVVPTLVAPDFSGFEVAKDVRVWDLRQWRRVDQLPSQERNCKSFLTRTLTLKRRDGYENRTIKIDISSKSPEVRARSGEFPLKLRKMETPTSYLGSETSRSERMATLPTYRWQAEIDVSKVSADVSFDITLEIIVYNTFQNDNEESVSLQVDADQKEVGIWVVLPSNKTFKEGKFDRLTGPKLANLGIATGGEIYASRDKQSFYWRILNPPSQHYYQLKWAW